VAVSPQATAAVAPRAATSKSDEIRFMTRPLALCRWQAETGRQSELTPATFPDVRNVNEFPDDRCIDELCLRFADRTLSWRRAPSSTG
jgi:hypothetical protein